MKILLVSGGMHTIIAGYASRKIDIVNSDKLKVAEVQDYLQNTNAQVEGILLTDEAFSQQGRQDVEELSKLLSWLANHNPNLLVQLITRHFWMKVGLEDIANRFEYFNVLISQSVRIPISLYRQGFEEFTNNKYIKKQSKNHVEKSEQISPEKKLSFFERLKRKAKTEPERTSTDQLTKEIEKISRGISRVVAVTGHRGAGLTSTAVNVACEASKRGLSVIIIDMDIEYRSTNMYFSSFNEYAKRDEDINASLIRTLARPQDYMTTAFNLKDNMWLASLGYSFVDRKLTEQFYTSAKLVGLLSMLRSKFNLIILDMPLDLFKTFKESLIHIDVLGLCIPNNIYSILSTLRNVDVALDRENANYINAKSKIVVTRYNDRARFKNDIFTPERVSEVLTSGLHDSLIYEMKVAGHVPHSTDFDMQIETDVPLVNSSKEHEKAYGNILLRLMGGAS